MDPARRYSLELTTTDEEEAAAKVDKKERDENCANGAGNDDIVVVVVVVGVGEPIYWIPIPIARLAKYEKEVGTRFYVQEEINPEDG